MALIVAPCTCIKLIRNPNFLVSPHLVLSCDVHCHILYKSLEDFWRYPYWSYIGCYVRPFIIFSFLLTQGMTIVDYLASQTFKQSSTTRSTEMTGGFTSAQYVNYSFD